MATTSPLSNLISSLAQFIPNLVKHYTDHKPIEQASELWAGIAAAIGVFAVSKGWITQADWNIWGAPACVYALARLTSKGLTPPPVVPIL
jgi:hypothetical protein